MTHISTLTRFAPLAAAAALLASGCGPATTSSGAEPATPVAEVALQAPQSSTSPAQAATEPTTTVAETTTTIGEAAPPVATCGEYGPIPPRPDSMPTKTFDTDGDGASDDEVTAYGGPDGWVVRVVENGATSEAGMPDVLGFAALDGIAIVGGRDHVFVRDFEHERRFEFGTDGSGCVTLIATSTPDGLTAVPMPPVATVVAVPSEIVVATLPLRPAPCGVLPAIPDDASIASDMYVDVIGDGTADEHLISYFDGHWKLRSTVGGIQSEVVVNDVGPHSVRALGLADVAGLTAGPEVIATAGGGAYTTEIGVFGFDPDGCIFRFAHAIGGDFGLAVGASLMNSSGVGCGHELIGEWGYEREADGTYTGWGQAFEEATLGEFSYLGGSDDYSEGLSEADLTPAVLECNGFGL